MNYKYVSESTFDNVGLHDCEITGIHMDDKFLNLEFEHIDILKNHPLNEFGCSKATGKAKIIFEDFNILNSFVYDKSKIIKGGSPISIIRPIVFNKEMEGMDVIVVETEKDQENDVFCKILCDKNGLYEFWFSFKKVTICWNEFEGDAWFAHWNQEV